MKIEWYPKSRAIHIYGKYLLVAFHFPEWHWSWYVPKYQNWSRLSIQTPVVDVHISGWLLWGSRPPMAS